MIYIEMHLNDYEARIARKYGKGIKSAGGRYSDVRGDITTRFVHLPITEIDLIDKLVSEFKGHKRTTIIIRAWRESKVLYVEHGKPASITIALNIEPILEKNLERFEKEHQNCKDALQKAAESQQLEYEIYCSILNTVSEEAETLQRDRWKNAQQRMHKLMDSIVESDENFGKQLAAIESAREAICLATTHATKSA